RDAFKPYPGGAHELQGLDPAAATELGEVIAGTRPGRTSPEQLTVYKSMGHAVEDAVAADLVYRAARAAGVGVEVRLRTSMSSPSSMSSAPSQSPPTPSPSAPGSSSTCPSWRRRW